MKKSAPVAPRVTLQRSLLSLAVASATLAMAPGAQAFQFNMLDGEVQGSFDTTISYGALWRVTGQDPRLLSLEKGGVRNSPNYDNGNASYRRGEKVFSTFRMNNELELKYQNVGGFFRVASFYDHEIQNKNFDPNLADQRTIRNRLGHDYEIFDAFVFGNFNIANRNVNVRLGKQAISLGESTFIPNGLNALNPVDVARLRTPGAEIKDALLPTQMLSVSFDLTDNTSIELINKFQFRESRPEPNGSYFSTNDFLSPGGSKVAIPAPVPEAALLGLASPNPLIVQASANAIAQAGGFLTGLAPEDAPLTINRGRDKEARHTGQYAIAIRHLSNKLNNTEFGFYAANYHNTAPLIAGKTGSNPFTNSALAAATTLNAVTGIPVNAILNGTGNEDLDRLFALLALNNAITPGTDTIDGSEYFAEYAENVKLYGISFNTQGPFGMALQGEYSYRPNQPLNMVANNILNALILQNGSAYNVGFGQVAPNTEVRGYRKVRMHQAQMTATQLLGRYFGADQIVGVIEAGYTFLDLPNGIDFNGPGVDFTTPIATNSLGPVSSDKGILTKNSYGYRAVFRGSYQNAIGAINISPRIAFQHDIRGTSPTFIEGTKAATLGITADYLNKITADISYTNFFGGRTIGAGQGTLNGQSFRSTNNQLRDRDFIAATISYAF